MLVLLNELDYALFQVQRLTRLLKGPQMILLFLLVRLYGGRMVLALATKDVIELYLSILRVRIWVATMVCYLELPLGLLAIHIVAYNNCAVRMVMLILIERLEVVNLCLQIMLQLKRISHSIFNPVSRNQSQRWCFERVWQLIQLVFIFFKVLLVAKGSRVRMRMRLKSQ